MSDNPTSPNNDHESRQHKLLRRINEADDEAPLSPAPADESPQPAPELPKRSNREDQVSSVSPFIIEDLDEVDRFIGDTARLNEADDEELEDVVKRLDEKIKHITQEFSAGRVNQAQFQAIFTRYREQREIITRMAAKHPDSEAWKNVATEGYTNILRKQHSATATGLVIIEKSQGALIKKHGTFSVGAELIIPLLDSLSDREANQIPSVTQIDGGRYLALMQGYVTATICLFSTEPPQADLLRLKHVHEEFEFSNNPFLHDKPIDANQLVYPQSQLLTE